MKKIWVVWVICACILAGLVFEDPGTVSGTAGAAWQGEERYSSSNVIYTAIDAGERHTCALTSQGAVKCWGENLSGQLGNEDYEDSFKPVYVSGLLSGVSAISAGWDHTCAVTSVGGVKCWGGTYYGQLGIDTPYTQRAPVDVTGLASGVVAVSAGEYHTCALTAGGGVKCWGWNSYGQLGNGSTEDSYMPVDVTGLTSGVSAIAAGGGFTCALTSSGGVKCWGYNGHGALGNGSYNDSPTPVDVSGLTSGISKITTGGFHACAVTSMGAAKCWGKGEFGELGDGNQVGSSTPVNVSGLASGVISIAAYGFHSCAVTTGGGSMCWGRNEIGQLGNGTTADSPVPVVVSGLASGSSVITAGYLHSCALAANGEARCWGENADGQLGNGVLPYSTLPVDVIVLPGGMNAIAPYYSHNCAVTLGGGAWCWGENDGGQLGNGTMLNSVTPVSVSGLSSGVNSIATGGIHSCAITAGGAAKCWGFNYQGQLGNGTYAWSSVPVNVSGLAGGVSAMAAGDYHTCALTSSGGVKCWGANDYGQLGNGTNTLSNVPVDVNGLTSGVIAIAAGNWHTCALTSGGGVKCWGGNSNGKLGNGSTSDSNLPVDVTGLTSGASAIAAGLIHSCAVTSGGGVKCWGDNSVGQLGDGTWTDSSVPVNVSGLSSGISKIETGDYHSCALTTGGGVKCWGYNSSGQLGDGTLTSRKTPGDVMGLTSGVSSIAAGSNLTCALTAGGSGKCWGDNYYGQLGDGEAGFYLTPETVVEEGSYRLYLPMAMNPYYY